MFHMVEKREVSDVYVIIGTKLFQLLLEIDKKWDVFFNNLLFVLGIFSYEFVKI